MKTIKKSQIKAMVNEAVENVIDKIGLNESLDDRDAWKRKYEERKKFEIHAHLRNLGYKDAGITGGTEECIKMLKPGQYFIAQPDADTYFAYIKA